MTKFIVWQVRIGAGTRQQLRPWIKRRTWTMLPDEYDTDKLSYADVQENLEEKFEDIGFLPVFKIMREDKIIFDSQEHLSIMITDFK